MALYIKIYQAVKTVAMTNSVGQRVMLKAIDQAVKTLAMTNSVGQRVMHESYLSGRQNLRYDKMY